LAQRVGDRQEKSVQDWPQQWWALDVDVVAGAGQHDRVGCHVEQVLRWAHRVPLPCREDRRARRPGQQRRHVRGAHAERRGVDRDPPAVVGHGHTGAGHGHGGIRRGHAGIGREYAGVRRLHPIVQRQPPIVRRLHLIVRRQHAIGGGQHTGVDQRGVRGYQPGQARHLQPPVHGLLAGGEHPLRPGRDLRRLRQFRVRPAQLDAQAARRRHMAGRGQGQREYAAQGMAQDHDLPALRQHRGDRCRHRLERVRVQSGGTAVSWQVRGDDLALPMPFQQVLPHLPRRAEAVQQKQDRVAAGLVPGKMERGHSLRSNLQNGDHVH